MNTMLSKNILQLIFIQMIEETKYDKDRTLDRIQSVCKFWRLITVQDRHFFAALFKMLAAGRSYDNEKYLAVRLGFPEQTDADAAETLKGKMDIGLFNELVKEREKDMIADHHQDYRQTPQISHGLNLSAYSGPHVFSDREFRRHLAAHFEIPLFANPNLNGDVMAAFVDRKMNYDRIDRV
jgi:hypothetical protein